MSEIAQKVTTCQKIYNRARESPEKAPPLQKDKKFEAFPCESRHEDVTIEKPKLIYDQNERNYERN